MDPLNTNGFLDALRAAMQRPEVVDGYTIRELARALHSSRGVVREVIRRLLETGQVESVRVWRDRMDGKANLTSAYRLKISREGVENQP